MKPDADIAIVGAGCAGLSLAAALEVSRYTGRVLLLEPRSTYTRDRTWCFWNTEQHPFDAAVSCSWHSWRVSYKGQHAVQRSEQYRYCHIAGDDFYRLALGRVERAAGQELLLETTVGGIETQSNGLLRLETSRGRLTAGRVFDARPPVMKHADVVPTLLQRFVGWHVRTEEACFDPETVELMSFLPSSIPGRIRFLYLLPFSAKEALVEMTYLDNPSLPQPDYTRDLEEWLGERARGWEVVYSERGELPMQTTHTAAAERNHHPIGIRGGRIKASSGYAFLRIQRHSRAIAEALRNGQPIPATAEPRLYATMDAVFLRALQRVPATVPALFLSMFLKARPDSLVRFLSEASGPAEMLRVAWSLPKLPMLQAAAQTTLQAIMQAARSPRTAASF